MSYLTIETNKPPIMKRSIPFLISGFFFLLLPYLAHATSMEAKDTIRTTTTWSVDTVRVTDNIVILDDITLIIAAGTRVEFQGPYYIYVQGTIIADGTETDTIVFTPVNTIGFTDYASREGCWDGILFYNGTGAEGPDGAMIDNDTSRFDHCRLEFTKSHPSEGYAWSAIEVGAFSRLVITHCEIRHNYSHWRGGAIRATAGSDIVITDNYIHHNLAEERGGGIYSQNSTPIITGNTITHNATLSKNPNHGKGGGIGVDGYNPVIRNNTISYNTAIYGPGIYLSNGFSLIQSNTISHNTGYNDPPDVRSIGGGIYMDATSSPLIISNKVANNKIDEGGGIYAYNSSPEIVNNLIVNNTGDSAGGAFYGWDSKATLLNNTMAHNTSPNGPAMELTNTEVRCVNNILWNNGSNDIHLQDTYVELYVVNSVIDGGKPSITGVGSYQIISMIKKDPEFEYSSGDVGWEYEGLGGEWTVPAGSPCVNAGIENTSAFKLPQKDLQGNDRINHQVIDIGAYEVLVPFITFSDTIKSDTTWIADTVKITGNVVVNDDVTLTVLPGTVVEFQDTFHLKVNGTLLAEGMPKKIIQFTADEDTSYFYRSDTSAGGWQGIIFDNSYDGMNNAMKDNAASVLKYCQLSYAKSPPPYDRAGAIVIQYYDNVQISNCDFNNNRSYYGTAGIILVKSDVNIHSCVFRNNRSEDEGSAIWAQDCEFSITDSWFNDNSSGGSGGSIRLYTSIVTVDNCQFKRNESGWRGGAFCCVQTETMIRNCLFANNRSGNQGGAIYAGWETINLVNNVIVNNTANNAGGGVYCLYSDDLLSINNTVAYNYAKNGGGIYTAFTNHRSINDLLYGNDVEFDGRQYGVYSVTASLDFRNGLFEGGTDAFGFWIGQELTGSFTDLIDTIPDFFKPSDGAGSDYDADDSDWRLFPTSPCINSGTTEGDDGKIPSTDFAYNTRIYGTEIDIGAYENQYGLPVITRNPKNQILCEGDSLMFRVRTEFKSTFQWQKDGEDIPGATSENFRIPSISVQDDGNYQCMVSNAFGTVPSSSAYLAARAAPEFLRQPENTWAVEGEKTIISSQGVGTPSLRFQWFKGNSLMEPNVYPDLWIFNTGTSDEALYHCELSNACGTVSTDTVQLFLAPQICMVTVDSNTSDNLVIWEKNSTAPIESYNVYRESVVKGEFEVIGNVAAGDLSVYVDTSADPVSQAYIYKITALDEDNNESDINLCKPHKTLHLLSSQNSEYFKIQCDWDPYYGFDYGTYYIYRGTRDDAGNVIVPLTEVHQISSSFHTWIDTGSEPEVNYFYRIVIDRGDLCSPTGNTKAGTGPYSHSLSNLDDNKMKATRVEDVVMGGLKIYPNPFTERTRIEFPNPDLSEYRVTIRDLSGKVVRMERTSGNQFIIERGNLAAGLYSVELAGQKIYRDRIVIR